VGFRIDHMAAPSLGHYASLSFVVRGIRSRLPARHREPLRRGGRGKPLQQRMEDRSESKWQEAGNKLRLGDARGIGPKSASGELVHLVGNRFWSRYNAKKFFALIL